ncbi:MAG: DUF1376 domain-containing protein [Sneathiella sp.]
MAGYPSMPLFVREYLVDTTQLSLEQSGAYLHLLMHAWIRGGSLVDDDKQLALYAKVSTKKWKAIRIYLEPFWIVENGVWKNKRLLQELQFVGGKIEKRRAAGKKGGRPKKEEPDTPPEENQSLSESKGLTKQKQTESTHTHTHTSKLTIADAIAKPGPKINGNKPEELTPLQRQKKDLFDYAVKELGRSNVPEYRSRSMVGKWLKNNEMEDVREAIGTAVITGSGDPISYVTKILKKDRSKLSPADIDEIDLVFVEKEA